jgi:hypothetical protein
MPAMPWMNYKKFLPFLLAFVLPLVGIYAWWGGFSPVTIGTAVRGPYVYAYLEHTGDYAKLPDRLGEARRDLRAQGIAACPAITVLYSNPSIVPLTQRKARVGCLVPAGTQPKAPLALDTIPARRVLFARVRAAVLLAPSRAYQALDDYLQARGRGITMPTVEIYRDSGSVITPGVLTVEMEAP